MSGYDVNVFISHSWEHSGHYDTLAEWIFDEDWKVGQTPLRFQNFSVPKDDPIHGAPSEQALRAAIYAKIALSHVIVIPMGMYANYSTWIQKELDGAEQYQKPVLAVNPWAQERKSSVVQLAASGTVGWNKKTVVTAIWNLYRS